MNKMLTLEHVSFIYQGSKSRALEDISLTVERGTRNLLCGVSGSGKSTLMRLLKPELAPNGTMEGTVIRHAAAASHLSAGDLAITDKSLAPSALTATEIGYVGQNPDAQIVTDKVWHELAFGLENLHWKPADIRRRVAEIAHFFSIADWFRQDTDTLSGGQKQLLNLASAMITLPEILLLDEPTAQLDPIAARMFFDTLERLERRFSLTTILAEHSLDDIFASSDRILLLDKGRLIVDSTPQNFVTALREVDPDHPITAALPIPVRVGTVLGTEVTPLSVKSGREALLSSGCTIEHEPLHQGKPVTDDKADSLAAICAQPVVLRATDLCFAWPDQHRNVIEYLNFSLHHGEICAIVGGNGSGKSTFLKLLNGVLKPSRGKIETAAEGPNHKLQAVSRRRFGKPRSAASGVSYPVQLPQDITLMFREMSLAEEFAKTGYPEDLQNYWIDYFDLTDLLNRHPFDLSGGEQQRAALALIMLADPDILLLDEPAKSIDAEMKIRLGKCLRDLANKGKSILLTSHDLDFTATYADTCCMMFDRHILGYAAIDDFFRENLFYTTVADLMSRDLNCHQIAADTLIDTVRAMLKDGRIGVPS